MARCRPVDAQPKFVAIDLVAQLLPGTFEHALHHLLEQAIDLTPFDARYRNDTTGAPAYAPSMRLRVVLIAYSRGIISSRAIARACEEQVTFIALSGDSRPHVTTIVHFVSTLGEQIAPIFAAVLAVCDRQGLIGREMFAIDGVKLPSHASKHRSGTRADFERQAEKMERAAEAMLARHRAEDAQAVEPTLLAKDVARRERFVQDAAELRAWLTRHPDDRRGAKGGVMGDAQAHGVGAEQALLQGVVAATAPLRTADTLITAYAGYHSEANLRALAEAQVSALIADGNMRKHDTQFATQDRETTLPNPLHDKSRPARVTRDHIGAHFQGAKHDGGPCALRAQCLRTPATTPVRNVAFFHGRVSTRHVNHMALMRDRIDSPEGRAPYAQRFATVEPVFANLHANKRLDRFALRGRAKVDTQWRLYCLVHNIEKLANNGYAA